MLKAAPQEKHLESGTGVGTGRGAKAISHFEIRNSPIQGHGVFASANIARGACIAVLDEVLEKQMNHCCTPNAGLRRSRHLYAYKDIQVGEEITYDYSSTIGVNMEWEMGCCCGASTCRRKIGNVLTLPVGVLREYLNADLLPALIKEQVSPNGRVLYEEIPAQLCPYLKAARALNLAFRYFNDNNILEIYLGKRKYHFWGHLTPFNDTASSELSLNKKYVNARFKKAGLPVPQAELIFKEDYLQGKWQPPAFGFPVVAKPTISPNGNGLDVYCNIKDEKTLRAYLDEIFKKYNFFTIEKYEAELIHYRVTVFFNRVIGVVQHEPAFVLGDGKHSIRELIEIENEARVKNTLADLGPLLVDRETVDLFKEMNLTLEDIPPFNKKITLSYTCNAGRGAVSHSLGASLCRENAELLCQAAKILNSNLVGFDVLCEDIQLPLEGSRGFIIEANFDPDLNLHELPSSGVPVPAAQIVLSRLLYRQPLAYAQVLLKHYFSTIPVFFRALFALGAFMLLMKWLCY